MAASAANRPARYTHPQERADVHGRPNAGRSFPPTCPAGMLVVVDRDAFVALGPHRCPLNSDLKMPGALEALDEIVAGVEGGRTTAGKTVKYRLAASIVLRNSRLPPGGDALQPTAVCLDANLVAFLEKAKATGHLKTLIHPPLVLVDGHGLENPILLIPLAWLPSDFRRSCDAA